MITYHAMCAEVNVVVRKVVYGMAALWRDSLGSWRPATALYGMPPPPFFFGGLLFCWPDI